jgi:ATP-binding cassette, subfamily B, bacterial
MNPHLQRLQLLRPFAPRLCAALCVMAVTVGIQLVYPRALSYFIDNVNTHRSSEWYTGLALTMLAILTAQAAASTLRYYLFETTGYMIVTRARRLLYGALMHKPIGFYDKHNVGELTSRLSADADVLHDTLSTGLPIALRSLLIFIGGTAMLLAISPSLSLVLVLFVPATILLAKWGGKSLRSLSGDIQGSQAECGKVANEHFANIRLVRAFNQHRTAIARYFTASERSLQVAMSSTRMFAAFRGMSSMLVYLALLATLWLGAGMIGRGELTIGELTAFLVYANMVSESAGAVSDAWSDWMRTIGATERVFEMMGDAGSASNASDAADKSGAANAGRLAGHIHFSDVSFHYPERPERRALDNVSFTVDVGEKIALVGPSGAGKSTIAAMLLGFYAPGGQDLVRRRGRGGAGRHGGARQHRHRGAGTVAILGQHLRKHRLRRSGPGSQPGRGGTRRQGRACARLYRRLPQRLRHHRRRPWRAAVRRPETARGDSPRAAAQSGNPDIG